jgi:hypothetical protein
MPSKDALYLLVVALTFAIGAAILAERFALRGISEKLWSIAILSVTAALTYLTAALTLHWF